MDEATAAFAAIAAARPDDPRPRAWLAQAATNGQDQAHWLTELLRCDPGNVWATVQLERLALARAAAPPPAEAFTAQTERLVPPPGVFNQFVPLPTPDPWASDDPGVPHCPYCGQAEPGARRCIGCGEVLVALQEDRRFRQALSAALAVLVFRGLMLVVLVLFVLDGGGRLADPISRYQLVLAGLIAVVGLGVWLRQRWAVRAGVLVGIADALLPLALTVIGRADLTGRANLVAALVVGALVVNTLILLDDRWGRAWGRLALPPDELWPKNPRELHNLAVACSRGEQWFFAARIWQRAVALHHHELQLRRGLGLAYLHLKQWDAAAHELRAAQIIDSANSQTAALVALLHEAQPALMVASGFAYTKE